MKNQYSMIRTLHKTSFWQQAYSHQPYKKGKLSLTTFDCKTSAYQIDIIKE